MFFIIWICLAAYPHSIIPYSSAFPFVATSSVFVQKKNSRKNSGEAATPMKSKTLGVKKDSPPALISWVNSVFDDEKKEKRLRVEWSSTYSKIDDSHIRIHPEFLNRILLDINESRDKIDDEEGASDRNYREAFQIIETITDQNFKDPSKWNGFISRFKQLYEARDIRKNSSSWQLRIPLVLGLVWASWAVKNHYEVSNASYFYFATIVGFYLSMRTEFFWRHIIWISLGLLAIWYCVGDESLSFRKHIPLIFSMMVWALGVQLVMWPLTRFIWLIYKEVYRALHDEEIILPVDKKDWPSSDVFYEPYEFQRIEFLQALVNMYRDGEDKEYPLVFMIGDSSFFNKWWVLHNRHQDKEIYKKKQEDSSKDERAEKIFWDPKAEPINGYDKFLTPGSKQLKSMEYWMSYWLLQRKQKYGVINAGVEERALKDSDKAERIIQDVFVRNALRKNDVLLVSIGGNDILLKYDAWIIIAVLWIGLAMQVKSIDENTWGIGTFVSVFKDAVQEFVLSLMPMNKENWPSKIVIMFPYFPSYGNTHDQSGDAEGGHSGGSTWASPMLEKIQYFDKDKREQFHRLAPKFTGARPSSTL